MARWWAGLGVVVRKGVSVQKIRGKDPMTLELLASELLGRAMGAIAPGNVADLMALSEAEDAPAALKAPLRRFTQRVQVELGDLPGGNPVVEFLKGLRAHGLENTPMSLRDLLAAEAERHSRSPGDRAAIQSFLDDVAEVHPVSFTVGSEGSSPRVQVVATRERTSPSSPRTRRAAGTGSSRASTGSTARKKTTSTKTVDPERQAWVRDTCLERLAATKGPGLRETVLIAGIKHRARERYPKLDATEVRSALKELANMGQAEVSAGRWRFKGRGW